MCSLLVRPVAEVGVRLQSLAEMMVAARIPIAELTLVDVVYAVRKRCRFVLALTVAIFAVFSMFAFTETPVYRAYVTLAPSAPLVDPNPNSLATNLLGVTDVGNIGVFQAQTSASSAFALLRSKTITRDFIETDGLLPVLFADEWDSEKMAWREADVDQQPTTGDALELFEREIRFISRDLVTGFVRVAIEWPDPELAANWANRLVELTDRAIRERDIAEARESIQYLEQRARNASIEPLRQLVFKLIESNAKKIMVANVKDSYVFTVIDPAIAPQADDMVNMPVSLKLSLALIVAFGCSALLGVVAAQFDNRRK